MAGHHSGRTSYGEPGTGENGDGMTMRAWVLRAGKGEREAFALETGLVGGGWDALPDLMRADSEAKIREVVLETYPEASPSAVTNYVQQLTHLRLGIAPGDFVVLPFKGAPHVAIGVVVRAYHYRRDLDLEFRHAVQVEWKKTVVDRQAFREDVRKAITFIPNAVFPIRSDGAISEMEKLAATGSDAGTQGLQRRPAEVITPQSSLGQPYRVAAPTGTASDTDPFQRDPNEVDRGLRAHAHIQNELAQLVTELGGIAYSPGPNEPPYDLAFEADGSRFVAEVKSARPSNEEKQIRLGLGQLLHYQELLPGEVGGILAVESEPTDLNTWTAICDRLQITLWWPGRDLRLW